MNKIILMGRLSKDPEIRYSQGENPMPIARYSLAVDKKRKREDGITVDYFNIVAFDRLAAFAEKYLHKGVKILLSGHVQTGTYQNREGVKIPFFEVVAEEQEFAESKNSNRQSDSDYESNNRSSVDNNGFMNIPDDIDMELPFN